MADSVAYKVLTAEELDALNRGGWRGSALDVADGFIHLSAAAQLTETVDKWFAGRSDLVVAAIHVAALGEAVRWEPSRGGALVPHVYGTLGPEHVLAAAPLARDADGEVARPA
ncbi:DUF952 domain-containing protein [Sphingomonas parva]|uniref:DUF952 domain-containing protein n=1 Tax=Sphingomonas parva TaxID=2555898 RepID=A0A4Y8ZQU6_9SPHN|nr:DUF952 domain-containing protein [Sphingomonas parva]TFI58398.1 DUF952 domain-containing protein [Sphingomonas parva]